MALLTWAAFAVLTAILGLFWLAYPERVTPAFFWNFMGSFWGGAAYITAFGFVLGLIGAGLG
jgi:hypothetical protein